VRRLFSTFPRGLPGAGLLVMRLAASIVLAARDTGVFPSTLTAASAAWPAFQLVVAIMLLAGLWTPITGVLVVAIEVARLLSKPADPWANLLLAALGLALVLVGPGVWSIDAWMFGWRRIDLRDRQRRIDTSGE
jgi:putative oxidoreductase